MARKKIPVPSIPKRPRYPDLAPALAVLEERMMENESLNDEKTLLLLEKWHAQLAKIQLEAKRLQKLEQFAESLKKQAGTTPNPTISSTK